MANLNLWAKGGLAILVIVSITILIERLTSKKYLWSNDPDAIVELPITTMVPSSTTEDEDSILNQEFEKCLTEHSSKFYHFSSLRRNVLINNSMHEDEKEAQSTVMNSSSPCVLPPGICMHFLLIDFSRIMEFLGIKLKLIEPSMLFCLLPSARRYNLVTRGFHPEKMRGLRNVMTFGVSEEEAGVLDKTSSRLKIIYSGFRIWKYPNHAEFWKRNNSEEMLHYLFEKSDMLLHLVVFYQRETYLWHPEFNNTSEINSKDMLFTEAGAFDNFNTSSMSLNSSAIQIYLPTDSRCFLLAMESLKFLECDSFNKSSSREETTLLVYDKNNEQLRNQILASLKELKTVFGSQMVNFWLWARTLLGWYEKCDILEYSSALELSIALKSVRGYNFTGLFAGSACHAVKQDFNLSMHPNIELKCQDIDVKIYLMREEKNVAWYPYNNGLNSYRQTFPIFEVCSTDVFGLKVNVPCDVNKIFEIEFGQNWKNTSINFNPESMKNVFIVNNSSESLH